MKKTFASTIAALFMTTSLVGPAAASDDAIRLGLGIGGMLLGEMMKGGGNRQRQPGKGDKLDGRVDGKPTRQASGKRQQSKAAPKEDEVVHLPIPMNVPIPEGRPSAEVMTAWIAAAPEREEQEAAAEAEMMQAPVVATDQTTTAAVEVAQASQTLETEAADVELRDNDGKYWGMVTPSQRAKASEFSSLGMNLADSYRAIGLTGPIDESPEPTGRDLIDENGKLWGNVPEEMADRVWKAVDMGMKPSDAIRVIAKLEDPEIVKARAVAEAEAAKAKDEKTLAECIHKRVNIPGTRWTECAPFEAQLVVAERKAKAERMAYGDPALANCIEKRLDPLTKDELFPECDPMGGEVNFAMNKEDRWDSMSLTEKHNDMQKEPSDVEKMMMKAATKRKEEAAAKDAILGTPPAAENKPAFPTENAENQTAAAPIVEAEKPAIDEGKTAAIEATPEAEKPAEKPPVKAKPKKLDL